MAIVTELLEHTACIRLSSLIFFYQVIKPAKKFSLTNVEKLRSELKRDHQLVDLYDLKTGTSFRQTVSSIAKRSLSTQKFSSFLYLLAEFLSAERIVETGTSLGINALYLAGPQKVKQVATIEASPILSKIAKNQFEKLMQHKIEITQDVIQSKFEANIIKVQPDICFLDADHRSEAIKWCIGKIMDHHPKIKCIVVHDIYWSKDMKEAWGTIVEDEQFSLTLDLFQAGIIFPNMEMPKQHFTVRF